MYFNYGNKEIEYLKKKDKKLALIIEQIGHINRTINEDIFASMIHHIVGQQISTKAQESIWKKICDDLKSINPETILSCNKEKLQSFGLSSKKVEYILDFSNKIHTKQFDLEAIKQKTDAEAIAELSSLKGIGVWTAEMILLFCLQRPNIFSYGDLGIHRGIRMVYHHKKIDKKLFEKYRKRFSPYCSVASFYFWAVSGGAIPEMKDYAKEK